jgi:uncharacterized protein YjeT (DUF2065 family)
MKSFFTLAIPRLLLVMKGLRPGGQGRASKVFIT